jgi:hypothetical protein
MQSIWRKHLIICLFLGLLTIPIYFVDLASMGRGRRQLDHTRFPRTYPLDLHHIPRHRCRLKFNCRPVISQVRSIVHSLLVNGALRDSARSRLRRLRKAAARTGQLRLTANNTFPSPSSAFTTGHRLVGVDLIL